MTTIEELTAQLSAAQSALAQEREARTKAEREAHDRAIESEKRRVKELIELHDRATQAEQQRDEAQRLHLAAQRSANDWMERHDKQRERAEAAERRAAAERRVAELERKVVGLEAENNSAIDYQDKLDQILGTAAEEGTHEAARRIMEQHRAASEKLATVERQAAAMREIIIVRDPDSGGWECMGCHRTAAYNDREGLEHEEGCALALPAGQSYVPRAELDAARSALALAEGRVATLEKAKCRHCSRCQKCGGYNVPRGQQTLCDCRAPAVDREGRAE